MVVGLGTSDRKVIGSKAAFNEPLLFHSCMWVVGYMSSSLLSYL